MKTSAAQMASGAPSMIQLGRRLLGVITLVVALIVSFWLWLAWMQVREGQSQRMASAARLLAGHANSYFGTHEQILKNLVREFHGHDPTGQPDTTLGLLRGFRNSMPDVLDLSIVGTDGRVLVSTVPRTGEIAGRRESSHPAWREDFAAALQAPGLSIGRPRETGLAGHWYLPLQMTVRDARGHPRYLLQADVPLSKQQALWRALALPVDATIGLVRDDGYLLSQLPGVSSEAAHYRKAEGDVLVEAIYRQSGSGIFNGRIQAEPSERLGAYQKLGQYPLYAFISQERSALLTIWLRMVQLPFAIVLGSVLLGFLVYARFARRYAWRMRDIEHHLAVDMPGQALPGSGVREIDGLVTALAQSRDALRAAAESREALLLAAAEAGTYAVREADGAVIAADAAFLRILDRPENEVRGQKWQDLFDDHHPPLFGSGEQGVARWIVRLPAAGEKAARWISVAEYQGRGTSGEAVRHGLAIDVTDREALLVQVKLQSQRLQALWQLATARDKTEHEKMQLMLRLALDVLRMDSVVVFEVAERRLIVHQVADEMRQFHNGQVFERDSALSRLSRTHSGTVVAADLRAGSNPDQRLFATEFDVRGYVSLPIWAGDRQFGCMAFMCRAPLADDFSADDRAFMELLGTWFGQLLLETQQRLELNNLAMTDGLTGLSNRRAADVRFQEEFARAQRSHDHFAIAVCDLDRFKLFNDHYGHDVGDQVLLHVSEILKTHLREGDWVARWGGEEFIVYLHHAESAEAFAAMERLRLAIRGNPVSTAHGPLEITISIGVGCFRGQSDLAAVLSEADGCLFEAKRSGRDRVVMSEISGHGTLWKAGMLQHALLERRVVPAYQVIVDLRSGQPVADEALARLIEPDRRIVPASEFIDAAEGINFIHAVDEVVARQAIQRCADKARARVEPPDYVHFINLSPQFLARRDLTQSLLALVREDCVDCGMADGLARPMVLEITERQLLADFGTLLHDLQPLLDFGFRLALDDFGSGYSSFLYLASLPVSFLKIEGWMVRNMHSNPKVLAMVQSIIALARGQGIITIAECVEDAATADRLRELGVDWAQGWHFGRPECEGDPFQVLRDARTGAP